MGFRDIECKGLMGIVDQYDETGKERSQRMILAL